MTRQTNNIVSFDEARRAHGARRSAAFRTGQRASSGAPCGAVYDELAYRADVRQDAQGRRPARAAQSAEAAAHAKDEQSFDDFFGKIGERAQKAKRQAAKMKADREFTKHYGSDRSAAPGDSGPRAAVYKGEMGSQHRRASRMQDGGALGGMLSAIPLPNFKLPSVAGKNTLIGSLALLVCLFACGIFLYEPAQTLYQEVRDRDKLAVEYAAVSARNEAIESEVRALSTPEGIQDRARKEFGWISEGEYAVSVTGVSPDDSIANFQATINPASIQAPDTWYSDLLDPFFGYE